MNRPRQPPSSRPGQGPKPPVDDYVAGLSEDGDPAEPGRFTLERGRARKLLEQRTLSRPTDWILLAVQAAVLRGAARITATVKPSSVDLTFDGAPFSADELDRIYDEALTPALATTDAARARRKLALSLAAARALDWSELTVDSGDERQATRLADRPSGSESVGPAPAPVRGTRITVTRLAPALGELETLRSRCRHAPVTLVANDEALSPTDPFPPGAPRFPLDLPGARGTAGFTPRHGVPPVLRLVQHGVLLEERPLPGTFAHFLAVINVPGLRTDLSGLVLIHDDAYRDLFEAVKALHERERPGVDLPALERQWLAAEVQSLLPELEHRRRFRRLRAYVLDTVMHALVLMMIAPVLARLLLRTDPPWLLSLLVFPITLLLGVLAADRWPLTFKPRPRDDLGRLIEQRLDQRPDLRQAMAREVRSRHSPLAFYFSEPTERSPRAQKR